MRGPQRPEASNPAGAAVTGEVSIQPHTMRFWDFSGPLLDLSPSVQCVPPCGC